MKQLKQRDQRVPALTAGATRKAERTGFPHDASSDHALTPMPIGHDTPVPPSPQ